jgi:hypothetical protein
MVIAVTKSLCAKRASSVFQNSGFATVKMTALMVVMSKIVTIASVMPVLWTVATDSVCQLATAAMALRTAATGVMRSAVVT